jgi:hypothetical protein
LHYADSAPAPACQVYHLPVTHNRNRPTDDSVGAPDRVYPIAAVAARDELRRAALTPNGYEPMDDEWATFRSGQDDVARAERLDGRGGDDHHIARLDQRRHAAADDAKTERPAKRDALAHQPGDVRLAIHHDVKAPQ